MRPGSRQASRRRLEAAAHRERSADWLAALPLSAPGATLIARRPWIVGHRGAAGEAVENTLPSFALAVAQGADMIELDAQLTRDDVLVVAHDFDLVRLAGRDLRPETASWPELASVRLRPDLGRDALAIPRLQDAFDALSGSLPINVELKRERAEALRLARAAAAVAGRANTLFSSFDWPLLAHLRRFAPGAALAPLADDRSDLASFLRAAERLAAGSLHVSERFARQYLPSLTGTGLPVLCYTVNDPDVASYLLDSGASGVFTDRPGRLREALGLSSAQSIRMPCSSP